MTLTSRDFVFWLQGLFEVAEPKELNEKQTEIIKRHLNLVFFHEIDPSYSSDTKVQTEMNLIHGGEEAKVVPINTPVTPAALKYDGIELMEPWYLHGRLYGRDEQGEMMRC